MAKQKRALQLNMGMAIIEGKRMSKMEHRYGNSVVPLEGGVEVYWHPRAGLVVRKQHRSGPKETSRVAKALKECAGNPDFIGCVTSKVPTFKPASWRTHLKRTGKA